jgi:diguanylate cyclase (GGDEF)-like protein
LVRVSDDLVGGWWALGGTMVLGRSLGIDIVLDAQAVSRRHASVTVDGASCEIRDLGSSNGTYVNGERIERKLLSDGDTIQLGAATLRFLYRDTADASAIERLRESALRDGLTGVFNRRYFDHRLRSELAYAKRHSGSLALVLCDIDHFKRVNDQLGHLGGDAVLKEVASRFGARLRLEDVVARYGGEELAIISRSELSGALAMAERIRAAVADAPVEYAQTRIQVTVSLGVASVGPHAHPEAEAFIECADRALYEAKRAGRNRVVALPQQT